MKRNYTALFLKNIYSPDTKSGFKTIREAEQYICSKREEDRHYYRRVNWLVINTEVLDKHLTIIENEEIEREVASLEL